MTITKVGVVGAGTMGSGIAQVLASCGYEVLLNDTTEELIDRGIKGIQKSLGIMAYVRHPSAHKLF